MTDVFLQIPAISVVIPMHNAEATIQRCLDSVVNSDYADYEIIAIDDCSEDRTVEIARNYRANLVLLEGGPYGPAYARNVGVREAKGELVLFVDSDVLIKPDTINLVVQSFVDNPRIDALFGSYDQEPGEGDFLSQFKNLSHHFVHQQSSEEGVTFWAGCGAIRKNVFMALGGFDADMYPKPSIEDIELGYRLYKKNKKIQNNHEIQAMHLKKWTLLGWIKTDVINRAIPWTLLILSKQNIPNQLNLEVSQRVSAMLLAIYLLSVILFTPILYSILLITLFFFSLYLLSKCNIRGDDRPIVMNRIEVAVICVFLLVIGVSVFIIEFSLLLAPLALLAITFLFTQLFTSADKRFQQGIFTSVVLCLAACFLIIFFNISIWHGIITLAVITLIVLLNQRLFGFFTQKRGYLFAIASIPFQLLYYFYSIAAFVTGGIIFFWRRLKYSG